MHPDLVFRSATVFDGTGADPAAPRDGLLARIEMHKARNGAGRELGMKALFEFPNRPHGAIGVQEGFLCNGHVGSPWMF